MLSGISPLCRLYCPTAFITASWVGKKSWATSSVPATSKRAQVTLVLLGQWPAELRWLLATTVAREPGLGSAASPWVEPQLSFSWWLSLGDILHCSGSGNEFCMEWCGGVCVCVAPGHWVFSLSLCPAATVVMRQPLFGNKCTFCFNSMWKWLEREGCRTIHVHFHLTMGLLIPLQQSRLA